MNGFIFDKVEVINAMERVLDKEGINFDSLQHKSNIIDSLVDMSLRGVDTHGVKLFPCYIKELLGGRSKLNPDIKIFNKSNSLLNIDADNALGIVAGCLAVDEGVQLAKKQGISLVSVSNSNHFGAASIYTLRAARQGLACFSFSNSDALVSTLPSSGHPFLGTNPLSFAVPLQDDFPMCLDIATSQLSYTHVSSSLNNGVFIEKGVAVDKSGEDLSHLQCSPHNFGSLLPLGGYKGQGLGIMVEVLTSLLSGMPFGHQLSHLYSEPYDKPRKVSHSFIFIDIGSITNIDHFLSRSNEYFLEFKKQNPNSLYPGEKEKESYLRRSSNGIFLDLDTSKYLGLEK
ncbi:Ldh family oxidoreductase [Vibrio lentus]|uniref:Ldh family oxidoreductase n=1 Tax=Vibrio lentus TaxID=136468 RepID=UPI000C82F9C1|nr:Ldh family oxidoreductase [Vibrio lentus]PMJ04518.1 hypothetical protein BCU32_03165 [Vibrio lentus]